MSSNHNPTVFLVMISGQIEYAEFPEFDNVHCKSSFVYGPDWVLTSTGRASDVSGRIILNFPLDLTFKSTNPAGWPQLVLNCYGQDWLGKNVVRGYGAVHVPTCPGVHRRRVALFVPESSSLIQQISGWVGGKRPEFIDTNIVARAEGREVTRVRTQGFAWVSFSVAMKDSRKLGYDVAPGAVGGTPGGEDVAFPLASSVPAVLPYHLPHTSSHKNLRSSRPERRGSLAADGGGGVASPEPPDAPSTSGAGQSGRRHDGFMEPEEGGSRMAPIQEHEDDPDLVHNL